MNTNRLGVRRWFLLCLFSLFPPGVSLGQQIVGNIIGEVQVERLGFPPKQILLNLQSRQATITSVYTDNQGRFGFYALPAGSYNLVIQDDDYAPLNVRVDLNPITSQTSYAYLTLVPKRQGPAVSPSDRPAGSNPNAIDTREYSKKFAKNAIKEYDKGVSASAHGDPGRAIEHFRKAIQLAPDFYPAHNELGRSYLAKSDFGAAQREFEEVIRLNQSDAEGHLNLGNVFLLTKRYPEAYSEVQEGLRRDPQSPVGHFVLGSIYQNTLKPDEAERELRQALQLDPKMRNVHLALVNLYLAHGKKPQAIAELKDFLKSAHDDPLSDKARQVLKKLESAH